MDVFDSGAMDLPSLAADPLQLPLGHDCPECCGSDQLLQDLAAAHIASGMDPLDAALQAQLDAPLLRPFLY